MTVSLALDAADKKQGNLIVKRPRFFNPMQQTLTADHRDAREPSLHAFNPSKSSPVDACFAQKL
jgi:hypothetical protein